MKVKIVVPIQDTESFKFDYDGNLDVVTYENMWTNDFRRTDKHINKYMQGYSQGYRKYDGNDRRYNVRDINEYSKDEVYDDMKLEWQESEGEVFDSNKQDITPQFFNDHEYRQDMFIIIIHVGIEEWNSITEMKFWLEDSRLVHMDKTIDDRTKLRSLPCRDLKIKIGEDIYNLHNCKILQTYDSPADFFKFAVIVEKIKY